MTREVFMLGEDGSFERNFRNPYFLMGQGITERDLGTWKATSVSESTVDLLARVDGREIRYVIRFHSDVVITINLGSQQGRFLRAWWLKPSRKGAVFRMTIEGSKGACKRSEANAVRAPYPVTPVMYKRQ